LAGGRGVESHNLGGGGTRHLCKNDARRRCGGTGKPWYPVEGREGVEWRERGGGGDLFTLERF